MSASGGFVSLSLPLEARQRIVSLEERQVVADCATLATIPGAIGDVVFVSGYYSDGDGGGGSFYFDSGSSATPDNGIVFSAGSSQGRWMRVRTDRFVNVKWFGAYGDNSHDDTAAIQAAIQAAGTNGFGAIIYFPAGTYKITDTIRVEWAGPSPWANVTIRGENAGSKTYGGAILMWHGSYTHPSFSTPLQNVYEPLTNGTVMFQMGVFDSVIEGLQFKVAPGSRCGCLLNFGFDQGGSESAINNNVVRYCTFSTQRHEVGLGAADYHVVWDYWRNPEDQNTEDCVVEYCGFGGATIASLWWRATTQPFGHVVRNCYFIQDNMAEPDGGGAASPYGILFKCDTDASSISVYDCDMMRPACVFYLNRPPQSLKMINCHSESYKKLVYAVQSSGSDYYTMSIDGGRHSGDHVNAESYGPYTSYNPVAAPTWGPSDYDIIWIRGDMTLCIQNCQLFQADWSVLPIRIRMTGGDIVSFGNRYPCMQPFYHDPPFEEAKVGRTFSFGDVGTAGAFQARALPALRGMKNSNGTVPISGTSTSVYVPLTIPYPGSTAYGVPFVNGPQYRVMLTIQSATSGSAISTPYVSGIDTIGFTVNLVTAPGVGKTVVIAYEMYME